MADAYSKFDFEVVDYQTYILDPELRDRQTNEALIIRGPRPQNISNGKYFVCIGAAQTFGRFCEKPYPTLLSEKLNLEVLNLGRGGAGPSFFSEENTILLDYINRGKFVIIQAMSGRSESNSEFHSKGLGFYIRVSDGSCIDCDDAFKELLERKDENHLKEIIAETRFNWLKSYEKLISKINVPVILLWFSTRAPDYSIEYKSLDSLFGEFPQLVNSQMISQLKKFCDHYVECVTKRGYPHILRSRFTGEPITIVDDWGGKWNENWYYPSPEMHMDAAQKLEQTLKKHFQFKEANALTTYFKTFYRDVKNKFFYYTHKIPLSKTFFPSKIGLLKNHKNYRKFIILSTARSGSTFLLGMLNSHSQVIAFGELFRDKKSIGWDIEPYNSVLQSNRLIIAAQNDPVSFLKKNVFINFSPPKKAVGFKIFYYHAQDEDRRPLWKFIQESKDFYIIHLKRKNKLRTFLSLKKAFKTNNWTNTKGIQEEKFAISIDYEECLENFIWLENIQKQYDDFFEKHHKIDLIYEELDLNTEKEMLRIQGFLGIDYEICKPITKKQSIQPLSQAISNYSELKIKFKGTRWEAFFD